ncbi:MAG: DNA-binding transcriptional regulator [Planctomycetaceae bacterium]|nr:DNA-binding transcriptional regulator [Planctomycetaceae bacterium]
MLARRSVALLVETSNAYARGIIEGIIDYVRHHESWSIYLPEQERGGKPPDWLNTWKGDGVIARVETQEIAEVILKSNLPAVDVSAARLIPEIPWVETDDAEIARLAFEHLYERGFRNLAYCGNTQFNWSKWRQDAFSQLALAAKCQLHIHDLNSSGAQEVSWTHEKKELARWLRSLPRPIGIMACYDIQAQKILDVCRELDIAVPEEMAIIGVDNDELICGLSTPSLTSVICDTYRTGYEAASLLDRLMIEKDVGPTTIRVKPLGVETRRSTETLAIDDPELALALRFIRENATTGINVQDVLKVVPLSRRVLENRFRKLLGRTPHEEIARLRVEKAKQLLVETDLKLSEIAQRSGFQHDEYMTVAFKKSVGIPPSKYRSSVQQ